MREIKFNYWDSKKKVMYKNSPYLAISSIGGVSELIHHEEYLEWVGTDYTKHIIPLQYTGLKDRTGAEIYEGYIVDFMDYSFDGESEYNCRGEIIFEDGTWHITNSISTSELFNYEDGAIKVIGNIFENPELLKKI